MAKAKKSTKVEAVVKKKAIKRAKLKKVVVKKKQLENVLANMEIWCATLREALEAYDGKKDRAVLFLPPHPPRPPIIVNEVQDCPPGEEVPCCCCALAPDVVELLREYLEAWKRRRG